MALVEKSALVAVPAATLYEIVNDVGSYPEFLPWCKGGRLLSRTEEELCGEIVVSKAGITKAFSTCNRLFPYHRIEIRLREGPFHKLEGDWEFIELRKDACKVVLSLEFEFSSGLMDKAFGIVFAQIANSLVDAFCKRANDLAKGVQI
ncbi:MAG TPA: type II toxin-antitoxin system RatA family toxin [Thiolapillus brandeum]|uniref:Type II toxin-antitoxin system RatA family toxin n=1 Tax=Thiolapillus brandeum TaxID=1076588 RepID=A0A831K295_9GAMM|nr:type II toxin-antitoxin system RatA family toxin [Thiolapillus brandeum]